MKTNVRKITTLGILAALSIVLMMYTRFPIIPSAKFLEFELADVPVLIGAFMFGPVAGLLITVLVAFIQALTFSAASGWVGFVMHVIATGTFAVVAGAIYKKVHTFKGAIIALIAGSLSMTLIMVPSNLFFTVKFFRVPYDTVVAMLGTAIVPFNLIKSIGNSIVVMLVYKTISRFIKNPELNPGKSNLMNN